MVIFMVVGTIVISMSETSEPVFGISHLTVVVEEDLDRDNGKESRDHNK